MTMQALPFILLTGLLAGSSLIASRFSVGQFQPVTYIGLRMVLASFGHLTFYFLDRQHHKWPTNPRLWRHAALLGVGTVAAMTAVAWALQFQSAGLTSLLLTCGPAITVLLAHFFLTNETLTIRKGAGVTLAMTGALLLIVRGESGLADVKQVSLLGYGLVLMATFCFSGMNIYARKFMCGLDTFDVASIRTFVAALTIMPLSVLFVGVDLQGVNGQGYLVLGYVALVGTFLALLLSFYNIKRFGSTADSMTVYIIPVVSGLGGALILDEQITPGMIIGMGLIAAGIAFINQPRKCVV